MKGTFFSSDFIIDKLGNPRLIEINTDTNVSHNIYNTNIFDYSEFFAVLETNNIDELHVVYKPNIQSYMVAHLSASLATDAPFITTFSETKIDSDSIFPTSPSDSDNKFILRMAYDETAILDSEYAKGTLNLLTLFAEAGDSGSVVNFYHSSSFYGEHNTLDYTINESNIPDVAVKPAVEEHSQVNFYKLGKSTETDETRWNEFITEKSNNSTILQQYVYNESNVIDNKMTSIRNFSIIYGSDLNLCTIAEYSIAAIFELPTDIITEIDDTLISNKIKNKHYHEYTTNAPKPFSSGLMGDTMILKADGGYTAIKDLQVNDEVASYFISGSPQDDNSIELTSWSSTGIELPAGSYLTSSIVVNVLDESTEYNAINEIVIDGTDKLYVGTEKMFLVYDSGSNATMFKYATQITPSNDYFYDISGSTYPITENNLFILNNDSASLSEIDVETTDTYLISGSNHYNMTITHNPLCFVAGTQISLSDNTTKNIEDVMVGDLIVTYNEVTGEKEINKVLSLKQPIHNDLVTYHFSNDTTLTCTFDHPFYVNGLELASYKPNLTNNRYKFDKEVKQINVGDVVKTTMGETSISLIDELPTKNTETYIFTVENNHNFYANDVLTHNKYCFIAGTKVTMSDNTTKNIEDIVIGDEVLSFNETNTSIEPKQVIDLNSPIHNDMVKYVFSNGTNITCTFDHPLYIVGEEHMVLASYKPELTTERYNLGREIHQIQIGDAVSLMSVSITDIIELPTEDTQTYIITVEDNHNFYANEILVHNK